MRVDPHSHADTAQGETTHLAIEWKVDFDANKLSGSARLSLDKPMDGPLDLDTRDLTVHGVTDADGNALAFEIGDADPVLGARLRILRSEPLADVVVRYETSPQASALMWLEPSQTDGGAQPFMLSQCQAIHARSIVPVQDSPSVRMTYRAEVTIPAKLSAVMSAAPGEVSKNAGAFRTLTFDMPQPIPAYLLAIAVGDIDSRDLGPRTRVYAEPGVVESAAYEFAEVEQMLEAAEALFGPYAWERYDFIVLPPSFPMGGMENPRMTFLTPTLLAGDRSLVGVLAHELAHSWTGNLVTNATNEDFWLNEGWTVYAERRILEAVYGEEAAQQDARLGRVTLEQTIEERLAAKQKTALKYDQKGLDPDGEFSKLPYEKGFLFVTALERAAGRERFDAFIQRYMESHRFQSLSSEGFLDFVRSELPEAASQVRLESWLFDEGLPADAPTFESKRLTELETLATGWTPDKTPDSGAWSTTETLYFLSQLEPLDASSTQALGTWLGLRETGNAELQCVWLARAAEAGVDDMDAQLTDFVNRVGRTKLLKPVLVAMAKNPALRPLAERLLSSNRERLHKSTNMSLAAAFDH